MITPNSERFIRRLNLGLERFAMPVASLSSPERRGYINEVAFRMFARLSADHTKGEPDLMQIRREVSEEARSYLSQFSGIDGDQLAGLTAEEWLEVSALQRAIAALVAHENPGNASVIISPRFSGCGILDACAGDLLVGDELIEIKAGDRPFRSTDIRQLLTYCALNFSGSRYVINRVSCANPRRGTYFSLQLDTVSLELSSKSAVELLSEIIYFVSSGALSR
ncbi:MAG: hypothetical protein ACLQJR_16485 [Stellaceae bacterium]